MNGFRAAVASRQPQAGEPRRHGRGRTWRVAVGGLAAAAAAVAAGGYLWFRGGSEGLDVAVPEVGYVLAPMDPDRTAFYLGGLHLEHPGKDVEVTAVEVLTSPNVEYLGAVAIWPRDYWGGGRYSVGPGFPPARVKDRHPALKVVIPAAETAFVPAGWGESPPPPVVLGLGFRIVSGDVGAVNGVRVTYKVNGAETYKDFHHAVTACVKPNPCDWPKGTDHEDDYEDVILRQFGLVPD